MPWRLGSLQEIEHLEVKSGPLVKVDRLSVAFKYDWRKVQIIHDTCRSLEKGIQRLRLQIYPPLVSSRPPKKGIAWQKGGVMWEICWVQSGLYKIMKSEVLPPLQTDSAHLVMVVALIQLRATS